MNIALGAASAAAVAYSAARFSREGEDSRIPVAGAAGAFVFAAQMLNFPALPGVSGHFLGAALVTVALGPATATLVMAAVLVIQCLGFADGGFSALGTNIFNMAVAGCWLSYALFSLLSKFLPKSRAGFIVAAAVTAWSSVVAASGLCALEFIASGFFPTVAMPAMLGVHSVIGIGEALITAAVIGMVLTARPDLISSWTARYSHTEGGLR